MEIEIIKGDIYSTAEWGKARVMRTDEENDKVLINCDLGVLEPSLKEFIEQVKLEREKKRHQ